MGRSEFELRFISGQAEIRLAEDLQRRVWGASEVVPYHMLLAAVHGGGLLIGAFQGDELLGFVFGFAAFDATDRGPVLRHHSHMLGVIPEKRDAGIGFMLKRAQWQWVRRQGVDRITWTYDPLQSRNANLNIRRLGAVCSTYFVDYYGEMTDVINAGLPSDRFQVDWWVNSPRVGNRLQSRPRRSLELGDYFSAGGEIINPTRLNSGRFPIPPEETWILENVASGLHAETPPLESGPPFYLVEIPPDFSQMKTDHEALAQRWRLHTREVFLALFERGYLATDFLYLRGEIPRSFYVFSDGERRLEAFQKRRSRIDDEN